MPIPWDAQLETGDELVDRQHRNIHELFNEVENAEDSREELMRILESLLEHVVTHFETEEELMRRVSYPPELLDRHVGLHRDLTQQAREKVLQFRSGELKETAPLVAFLREWVAVHVHDHDRELIRFVREQGRAGASPG